MLLITSPNMKETKSITVLLGRIGCSLKENHSKREKEFLAVLVTNVKSLATFKLIVHMESKGIRVINTLNKEELPKENLST